MIAVWLIGIGAMCAGFAWVTNGLALIPWRRARDAHWTERARLLYPVRAAARSNLLWLPLTVVLAVHLLSPEHAPGLLATGFVAWLGTMAGTVPLDLAILPWISARDLLRQAGIPWLFRFARWFLFLGAMALMPASLDWRGWLLAGAVVALQVCLVWGGAIWLCARLGLVKPARQHLRTLIDQAAGKLGIA